MTQLNYYLDDYTDEVIPCLPTLEAWAEWLAKPDPDDASRDGPAADGDAFSGFTIEVLGDIRVEHLGGEWRAVEPAPAGTEIYYRRRHQGSQGWDVEFSGEDLAEATDLIEPDEGPLFFACTRAGDGFVAAYRADPPRLVLEELQ